MPLYALWDFGFLAFLATGPPQLGQRGRREFLPAAFCFVRTQRPFPPLPTWTVAVDFVPSRPPV